MDEENLLEGIDPEAAAIMAEVDEEIDAEAAAIMAEVDAGLAAETESEEEEEDDGPSFYDRLSGALKSASEYVFFPASASSVALSKTGQSIAKGVVRAPAALLDSASSASAFIQNQTFNAFERWFNSSGPLPPARRLEAQGFDLEAGLQEFVGPPQPGIQAGIEEISRFAAGAALMSTGLGALGVGSTAAGILGSGAAEVTLSDLDNNLANIINEHFPFLANPVSEYLAADEDDTTAEKTLKAFATGIIPDVGMEVFLKGLRVIRSVRAAKVAGKDVPQDAVKEAEDLLADLADEIPDPDLTPPNVVASADDFVDPLEDFSKGAQGTPAEGDLQAVSQATEGFELPAGPPVNRAVEAADADLRAVAGEEGATKPKPLNVAEEALPATPGARIARVPGKGYHVTVNGVPVTKKPFRTYDEAAKQLAVAEMKFANDSLPLGQVVPESLEAFKKSGNLDDLQVPYAQSRDEALSTINQLAGDDVPVYSPKRKKKPAPRPEDEPLVGSELDKAQKAYDRALKNLEESRSGKRVNLLEVREKRFARAQARLEAAKKGLPKRPPEVVVEEPPVRTVEPIKMAEQLFPGKSGTEALKEAARVLGLDVRNTVLLGPGGLEKQLKGLYNWTQKQLATIKHLTKVYHVSGENPMALNELGRAVDTLGRVYNPGRFDANAQALAPKAASIVDDARIPKEEPAPKPKKGKKAKSDVAPNDAPEVFRGKTKKEIQRFVEAVDMADGDHHAMSILVRAPDEAMASKLKDPTKAHGWRQFVRSWMFEALLSRPRTHLRNIVSTLSNLIIKPVGENIFGGASEYILGDKALGKEMMQEGWDIVFSLFSDWDENLKMFKMAYRRGSSILDPGEARWDAGGYDVGPIHWGNALTTQARRLLMAEDEFMKQAAYRSWARAHSFREARRLGITDKENLVSAWEATTHFYYDEKTGAAINKQGLEWARQATFTDHLNPDVDVVAAAAQKVAHENTFVGLFVPFVRSPYRVFETAWKHTPGLNRLNKNHMADIRAGGERAAKARGRTLFGVSAFGVAATLAYAGVITGNGPTDYHLKRNREQNGWQPRSIRVRREDGKDIYIDYSALFPLTMPLAMIADAIELRGEYTDEEEWMEVVGATVSALSAAAANETYVRDFASLLQAITSGDLEAIQREIDSLASSMVVPGFFDSLNPDPYYREASSVIERIQARVPGWSEALPARRNIFGEKVMKRDGYWQAFNPFQVSRVEDPVLDRYLEELGKGFSPPPVRIGSNPGVMLDDPKYAIMVPLPDGTGYEKVTPYSRMMEIIGAPLGKDKRTLREIIVEDYLLDPEFLILPKDDMDGPGGEQWRLLNALLEERYEAARQQVIKEWIAEDESGNRSEAGAMLARDLALNDIRYDIARIVGKKRAEEIYDKLQNDSAVRRVEEMFGTTDE